MPVSQIPTAYDLKSILAGSLVRLLHSTIEQNEMDEFRDAWRHGNELHAETVNGNTIEIRGHSYPQVIQLELTVTIDIHDESQLVQIRQDFHAVVEAARCALPASLTNRKWRFHMEVRSSDELGSVRVDLTTRGIMQPKWMSHSRGSKRERRL